MQKLCFLLKYSSRLGSCWSTTKVSLTAPSRVEQQVVDDVTSRRSGRSKACDHQAKHAIGAGFRPDTRSRRCAQCASRSKLSDFVSQRHLPPNGIEDVRDHDSAAKWGKGPPHAADCFGVVVSVASVGRYNRESPVRIPRSSNLPTPHVFSSIGMHVYTHRQREITPNTGSSQRSHARPQSDDDGAAPWQDLTIH